MPFERYLQHPPKPAVLHDDALVYLNHHDHAHAHAHDPSPFSSNVQFQVPHLMLGPTLAPGGGAEALPAGMLGNAPALSAPWFTHQAFARAHPVPAPVPAPDLHDPARFFHAPPAHLPPSKSDYDLQKPPTVLYRTPSSSFFSALHPDLLAPPLPHLSIPSALGLPVYSASGFDLLSILARVATRPNPKIALGPVDMTCAFVVTDKRRFDNPVVYVSPSFCKLTGYSEQEVLGSNCRFLQAPHGNVQKGEHRRYTSPDAVNHLRAALSADKECQTSMINYRKGGAAFINLVTVIPVPGGVHNTPNEADDYVYHVGFQVDLTEQPNAILNKLRDGTYLVNYSNSHHTVSPTSQLPSAGPLVNRSDWRSNASAMSGASKDFRTLLTDPSFIKSRPLNVSATSLATCDKSTDPYDGNKLLNLLLLESTPDFVHVVSLKGAFLYVAPSVKRVLGWDPQDLVGRSVTEFCHPADIVPLMRELKESSSSSAAAAATLSHLGTPIITHTTSQASSNASENGTNPKAVDLLFRIQSKPMPGDMVPHKYMWLECRGRMHIEPGKGRKAIILSGRVRAMPALMWPDVPRALLLRPASSALVPPSEADDVWALLSTNGTFLFVGMAVKAVLGWGAGEVIGKPILELLASKGTAAVAAAAGQGVQERREMEREQIARALAVTAGRAEVQCGLCRKDGGVVQVTMVIFSAEDRPGIAADVVPGSAGHPRPPPPPLVCLIRLSTPPQASFASYPAFEQPAPQLSVSYHPTPPANHQPSVSIFEELAPATSTSWQYELQQLKYANQRLQEDVLELEGHLGLGDSSSASTSTSGESAENSVGAVEHARSFSGVKRGWEEVC